MSTAAPAPRADERWLAGVSPVERLSATMAVFVAVSVAIHAAMMAMTLIGTRPIAPPRQEIAVEIVQEVPKEPPATKPEAAKAEPAKLDPPKPDAIKPDAVKPEPPPARVEPASAPPKPVSPPVDAAAEARKAEAIKAMESELASLKAQQAALQAEREAAERAAAAEPAEAQPAALHDTGLGPLPQSFQAVALPASADGAGEAVGYRDIVFSALAKAKEIGGEMGLPGSAGVHFEIDASGRLISVALVHPSGVAALDAQALAIVRKAAPFPPPPQGAQRNFDANVSFVTASGR